MSGNKVIPGPGRHGVWMSDEMHMSAQDIHDAINILIAVTLEGRVGDVEISVRLHPQLELALASIKASGVPAVVVKEVKDGQN